MTILSIQGYSPPPSCGNLSDQPDQQMGIYPLPASLIDLIPQDRNKAFEMGIEYGWKQNTKMEVTCYEIASNLRNAHASLKLGQYHEIGSHGFPKNINKAIEYYKKAIDDGQNKEGYRKLALLQKNEGFFLDAATSYLNGILNKSLDLYEDFIECLLHLDQEKQIHFLLQLWDRTACNLFDFLYIKKNVANQLGNLCLDRRNPKEAFEWFMKEFMLQVTNESAINFLNNLENLSEPSKFRQKKIDVLTEIENNKSLNASVREAAGLKVIEIWEKTDRDRIEFFFYKIEHLHWITRFFNREDNRNKITRLEFQMNQTAHAIFTEWSKNRSSVSTPEEIYNYGKKLWNCYKFPCIPAAFLFFSKAVEAGSEPAKQFLDNLDPLFLTPRSNGKAEPSKNPDKPV